VLEFPEDIATAIGHLKTTLPLLTKHKLPPNPINYGVWYLYASARSKELVRALDALVATHGTCPEHEATNLFRQYLIEEHNGKFQKATGKLHLLTQALQASLQDTLQTSNQMDRQLGASREVIRNARQQDDLSGTVEQLLQAIDQLSQHNRDYRRIVQSADGEIDRLKIELSQLQRASDIDELTQLYNRAALFREISKQINTKDNGSFSLILMDIDHFKSVNDRFGHLMGDRVLQRIGSLLLQQLRPDTMAARFGGEEFAILCPDTNLANAGNLAERLRDQMQRLRIKIRNSETVLDSITASFGIACYRKGDSIDSLFERADKAMYTAKEDGRNRARLEKD
jgi:diguanylate cyclase